MKTTTQQQDIKAMPIIDLMAKAFLTHGDIANCYENPSLKHLYKLDQMLLELNARNVGVRERPASDETTVLSFLTVHKHGKNWALMEGDDSGEGLICLTVYKKGAQEVLRRLDEVIEA